MADWKRGKTAVSVTALLPGASAGAEVDGRAADQPLPVPGCSPLNLANQN